MRIASFCLTGALAAAAPAAAQYSEIGGANLDAAGSIAGTMAVNSHLDGDDDEPAEPAFRPSRTARRACANPRAVTKNFRPGDPRIGRLYAACRKLGLRR